MKGFSTEAELVDFMTSDTPESYTYYCGIVFTCKFENESFLPERVTYKIRLRSIHLSQEKEDQIGLQFRGTSKWHTDSLMPSWNQYGPREEDDADGGEPCEFA